MNKNCKVVFCAVAFLFALLFSGCSDLFNDKWEDSADKLADAMGTDFNPTPPTTYSDTVSGTLSSSSSYVIYRFYAYAGTTYNVSWTSSNGVSFYYGYSATDINSYLSSYYSNTISTSSDKYVYIEVSQNSSYSKSFSMTVSCVNKSFSLYKWEEKTENSHTVSNTISNSDGYIIYKFYSSHTATYNVSWTNSDGANMSVSAGDDSDYESYFSATTTSGRDISVDFYNTVYIKVMPADSSSVGTFSLTVTETSSSYSVDISVYENELGTSGSQSGSDNSWTDSEFTSGSSYKIYRFYASSNETYSVYFDDSSSGSGTQTCDVKVYYSIGSTSFSQYYYDYGYYSPISIDASSSEYVYLKVMPHSSSNIGTFRIRVTDSNGTTQTLYLYSYN